MTASISEAEAVASFALPHIHGGGEGQRPVRTYDGRRLQCEATRMDEDRVYWAYHLLTYLPTELPTNAPDVGELLLEEVPRQRQALIGGGRDRADRVEEVLHR